MGKIMGQPVAKEDWVETIEKAFPFPCRVLITLYRNKAGRFSLNMTQLTGTQARKNLENLKFKELGYFSLDGGAFTPLAVKDFTGGGQLYDEVERLNNIWVEQTEVDENVQG